MVFWTIFLIILWIVFTALIIACLKAGSDYDDAMGYDDEP